MEKIDANSLPQNIEAEQALLVRCWPTTKLMNKYRTF